MSKNASLLVNSGNSTSQVISLNAQKTIKIKIQPGSKYVLKNEDDNFAPENITLQRHGDNLNIILEGDSNPAIVIEDYYATGNDQALLGMAEDGQLYAYMVTDGSAEGYLLEDGSLAPAALAGTSLGDGSYLFANTETDDDNDLMALWPWFLGAVVAGIAGGVINNHNKHHHKDSSTPEALPEALPEAPVVEPKIAAVPTLSGATDMTGTITGPISYGSSTDEKNPTIYGTGEAGNTITIYDNGIAIGTAIVNADGTWNFKPETALKDGDHKITVTQTEPSGSTSAPSDDFSFIVDTIAPLRPLFGDIIDNVGDIQGPIANGATTDDARPEITGTGEPGNTVTIFINGEEAGEAIIDSNGNWTWTPETDLADGHYQVTITETDKAGNVSPLSPTFDFNIDTSVPIVADSDTTAPAKPEVPTATDNVGDTTGAIEPGSKTDDATPTFNGEGDAGDTIIIKDGDEIIGSVIVDEDGKWEWTPETDLAEGDHSITVIEKDEAGNESAPSDAIEFTVDTIAPAKPEAPTATDNVGDTTGAIEPGSKTDDATPTFNGEGDAGDTIIIKDGDEIIGSVIVDEDGKWEWTPETDLSEGDHSITVIEKDEAGNESAPSDAIEFTVDTIAPTKPEAPTATDNVGDTTGAIEPGSKTDDATPTFNGEGDAGDIIIIKDGDEVIGSTVVDADGKWEWTPETDLSEGDHSITIIEKDEAGNESAPSDAIEFTVDTIAPAKPEAPIATDNVGDTTGAIEPGSKTDDATPTFNGEGDAGDTIIIKDGDEIIGSVIVDEDGKWEWTPETDLSEGDHSITVIEKDEAGNESAPSDAIEFTVDTIAPSKPEAPTATDNVGDTTGAIEPGSKTDDATPTFNGEGDAGDTIIIKDGDEIIGSVIVDEDGKWEWTPETELSEGDHSITVIEKDEAGNESAPSDAIEFTVDTVAPTKPEAPTATDNVGDTTGAIEPGSKTDDATPTFNGEGDAGDIIIIKDGDEVIGSTVVDADGKWEWTPETDLSEGDHSITVIEKDEAGNESAPSDAIEFTVDTIAPSKPEAPTATDNVGDTTGAIEPGSKTDDATPTFNGEGDAGDTIIIKDGDEIIGSVIVDEDGKWEWTPETDLSEGDHSITIIEKDEAGNESAPSDAIEFTVDTIAPDLANVSIIDNVGAVTGALKDGDITDDNTPTFSGQAEANGMVIIYNGDEVIGSAKADASGDWTFTPDTLADGDYQFTTTVTDEAGNTGEASAVVHITIDTSAIEVTITKLVDNVGDIKTNGVTDDARPEIIGDAKADSIIHLYDGETLLGSTTVDNEGHWSFTPATDLSEGEHSITATATGKAGNVSVPTTAFTFTVDTVAPAKPEAPTATDNVGDTTGAIEPGSKTDDATPTFNGEGDAGDTIIIKDGDEVIGSTVVDADGKWEWTPETDLSEGDHSITVIEKDEAGNESAPSDAIEFTVDTIAPSKPEAPTATDNVGDTTGAIEPGSKTDDATPTFNGEGDAGDTIIIKDGDEIIGSVIVDEDGKWEWTPETDLSEGDHSITVIEKDEAGNESAPSDAIEFTVDTIAPSKPEAPTATDNVGETTGAIEPGSKTDDATPTFNGEGDAGDTIIIKDGDEIIGSVIVDEDGKWEWTPETDLSEGDHSITVIEKDEAGNESAPSDAIEFTVDTIAPSKPEAPTATDNVGDTTGAIEPGSKTDDATPTFNGEGDAGDTIIIKDGDEIIGSVIVDEDGKWEWTPETDLSEGDHSITVIEKDEAGNESAPSDAIEFTVDTIAPAKPEAPTATDNVGDTTGAIEPGSKTDDATPTFNGEGDAGDIIIIKDGDEIIGSVIVDEDGKWEWTPETDLSEGDHSITVIEKDEAGNESAPSDAIEFTVDTIAPAKPEAPTATDNVGDTTGAIEPGSKTDDATPTFNGEGDAGDIIIIKDGDEVIGSTVIDADGKWEWTPETDLAEGEHSITVIEKDEAGNESAPSDVIEFTVDTIAPDLANVSIIDNVGAVTGALKDGDITDDNTPTFSGQAEANGMVIIYNGDEVIGSAKADASGEGKAGSTIKVYDGETLLGSTTIDSEGNWSFTPAADLSEGAHSITATATDKAGNVSEPTTAFTFTVDTVAPTTPTIDSAEDNVGDVQGTLTSNSSTDDTTPALNGTAEKNSTVNVYDGETLLGTTTADSNGKWTFTTDALTEGEHTFHVTATDKAGNVSQPSDDFVLDIDFTAPAAATDLAITDNVGAVTGALKDGDTTDDNTPTFSGQAEANGMVIIYNGDDVIGSVKADASGDWTFTPDTLADGDYQFTTTVTDAAGNTGEASAVVHITIDTSVVTVTITKLVDNVGDITGDIKANDITDDTRPEIIGEGKADSTINVYDGETLLGSTTADAEGNWSFTPATNLSEGAHSITATATDKAGNVSEPTTAFTFTVDTVAPTTPTIDSAEDNVGDVQGTLTSNSSTDDTTPALSGTAEKNSTVNVYEGETLLGSTTADSNGKWTFTTDALTEGEHTFHVTATDKAGNVSQPSNDFVLDIDFTAPAAATDLAITDNVGAVTGALKDGDTTDDNTPTFSGQAEANGMVIIHNGDDVIGSAKADASGNWTFTPDTLADGDYQFTTTVTDAAGNTGEASAVVHITIDTSVVTVTITKLVDNVGDITGDIKANDITDDTRPEIIGDAKAGSTIKVYDGETLLGSTTADAEGNWSFTPAADLSEGAHSVTATATDKAGNVSEPTTAFIFTVDTVAPTTPTIDSAEDNVGEIQGTLTSNSATDDATPTLNGSAEKNSTVNVYDGETLLGTTTADSNGKWTFTTDALTEGEHTFHVTATDKAGNVSQPSNDFVLDIDFTAPAAATDLAITDNVGAVTGALKDGDTTDDNTPTFSGQAEANGMVIIHNGDDVIGSAKADASGNWTFTPDTLADGDYQFTTTVTDAAGNTGEASAVVHITIDTSVVTVTITKLVDNVGDITGDIKANDITDDTRPEIIGDAKAGSTIKVYDGETLLGSTTADAEGNWSFTPAADLSEGAHSVTATATDKAGNVSEPTTAFIFTVDTVAPTTPTIDSAEDNVGEIQGTLTSNSATDDATPTLNGSAEKNSTVNVYDGETLLGTTTADSNGKWTFTTDALAEGKHTFHVTATDKAGNVSQPSDDFVLTMDFTAPDASKLAITGVDDQTGIVTGNVKSGDTTDDTRPTISGTGTAGDIITVYTTDSVDKHVIGSTTVDAEGNWSLKPAEALAQGENKFTAVEMDPVGNLTDPCKPYTIILDTFVSDAKVTITEISDDRGGSSTDFITNDNTLLISGTLDKALLSDETVEITLDNGKTWTKATTLTDTGWTVDLQSTELDAGDYTIKARVVDTAGNIGSTDNHALTIALEGRDMTGLNTTAKISTDTSHGLASGDVFSHSATVTNTDMVTRDNNVTVSGTLSTALLTGEKLQISLDNGTTWQTLTMTGNNWSYVLPEVSVDTTYNYKLQVIDNAGNVGKNTSFAENYKVVIDLTVPDALVGAPDIAKAVSTKDSFTFDSSHYGTVEAGTIVALVSDENGNGSYQEGLDQVLGFAKANADGSWSLTTSLPAGAHNLAFMVWDEAGNHSSMGASTSVGVTDGEGSLLIAQSWGGTTDSDGRGLNSAAVTISQDGLWSFFQSVRGTSGTTTANAGRVYTATDLEHYDSTYLAQPMKANGAGYDVDSSSYSRYINSAVFADINRDGYTDVMSQVSSYQNGGYTAYWMQNADGSFSPKAVDQGTLNHLGGVIAYDREGDGYLDFVLADSESDSISFLKNDQGVLSYEKASGFANGHPGGAIPAAMSIMHEVGAVDIDNNGTVDITAHVDYNGAGNNAGNGSRGLGILYNELTGTGKTNFGTVGYYANVFTNDGADDYGNLSISMTYADFNGDGWLDLFLSRGTKGGANSDESRIYLNDGTGKLMATDSQALWFGDKLTGGTSLAVDWNHDGKVDIIEIPRSGVNGSPTLYTNNGTNAWGANATSLTGSTKFDNITGAVALDYDWDGSMDIVLYRSGSDAGVVSSTDSAPTLLVKNTNIAADGTSLQIRIVDGNGINTFYSNTVKLYDSKGNCVATQLINPQASGSSNSMGLVSFFGLDPNEVYSVQLLRITNGVTDHVGASSSIGGYTNNTVNVNWGGLTTGKSHDAYVLTAESTDAVNNTTGTGGIIGTGYNDTFFGSAGDDTYTGGGGWNRVMSGQQVWSETEGMDIVDYSRSASAITADLKTGVATGQGNDKLVSIEGLIGTDKDDTFTDNAANNLFEGRGGNDTFHLTNGGNDTLMYKVQAGKGSDSTGGNGHDTVYGFTVGNLLTNKNADLIDLSDILNYSGPLSCFMDEGVMKLDSASQGILNYLKVEQVGGDTIISIDRDGKGGAYGFEELLTLKGVSTDLVTLLSNNQIEVGDDTLTSGSSGTHSLLSTTQQSLMSISQMFTAGDDMLFGTDKADILMGGLGNDTFNNISTGDQVMGGAGNDVINITSTDFGSISGDEGIDTLVLAGHDLLLNLSALKDNLSSVEIFDMGNGHNTMTVSLDDVLRLGSEELAIHSGDKAIIVNGEEGSTLKLESGDGQWTMSQSNYQHDGHTYNVWGMSSSGIEILVEETVSPIIM
ncbi:Ig-like domain repeat protein [Budviciaceae bacterium BWR-B9]|uniref:Ig-like domain repeat protein n=1 Tax=Limnobaculum allomyrinae TaxID=2791986 RepID=A0ABS1IR47_9GAMM|nr:Ig-like domain-containing protein [Limnobaculum allomyrinae]MBK5143785.1 Ig-like domain repeat protein [Limnobaculum allomyrinae]